MRWSDPAIWRERPRGGVIDPAALARPGLEQLRMVSEPPGMSRLTGVGFDRADEREAWFSLPVTDWLRSGQGPVPGGVLALPADGALGCAIHTMLGPHTVYTTAELSLTYLRRIPIGERVTAAGRALHVGRRLGFSACDLTSEDGTLIAHATSRVLILDPNSPGTSGTASPRPLPAEGDVNDDPLDPWERPVAGIVMEVDTLRRRSGLEMLRAQIDGDLPPPPLHHLLGITPVAAVEGRAEVVMPVTSWLATPWGWPQGGFTALLADVAVGMAVQTTVPAGSSYANVDLKVNYLRPLVPDREVVRAVATVVHRGRSLAVANVEIVDVGGRRLALATGSAHVAGRL
ncbi:MAG: PaaI family thioesterase [Candidatus Dormibacteria bacterium]